MNYTKGNWKVIDGSFGFEIVSDQTNPDDTVDIADISNQNENEKENEANAHLIAAAPEIYEALKAWMVYAESNYSGDGMTAVTLTKQALAKAEGK